MTTPLSRWLLARFGAFARGRALHHAALAASHAGEEPTAAALFARAARAYRRDLDVRALARLRIHEAIARQRGTTEGEAASFAAGIEDRLGRLDEIESLEPPFAPVPAAALLATLRREPPPPAARAA